MPRRLHLNKETLAALTDDQLAAVAGAEATAACPTPQCLTDRIDEIVSLLICRIG